jgi:hypothetical protein
MFPVKYCGLWSLVYTTNPTMPHNTLMNIQYNRITISPFKDYSIFQVRKKYQGVVKVDEKAKIYWTRTIQYEIDSPFLPTIEMPGKCICKKMMFDYSMDESNLYCTFKDEINEYVFQRTIPEKKDGLIKIFATQLLFDLIIRHI